MDRIVKTIAFRVDVAPHIGTGHLQRCLTLATQLKESFVKSIFFVRQYDSNLLNIIDENGFEYSVIGSSTNKLFSDRHAEWLGVTQQIDAEEFLKSASDFRIDGLVIDHYSIDYVWESTVKERLGLPILVIDDLANRKHNCEILLDQNYWPDMDKRYTGLIPDDCQCFFGPEYALLKPIFYKLIRDNMSLKPTANTVLVNFGGVGNFKLWQVVLPALLECNKFNFHIVTGKLLPNKYTYLSSLVRNSSHIYIEEVTNKMPELMRVSAYSLGACGSTVWERFCLGLNSALIDIAENQRELVKYLDEQELIDYLGSLETITTEEVINFITNLQLDSKSYVNRKSRIQDLVDGLGPKRIESHIIKIIN